MSVLDSDKQLLLWVYGRVFAECGDGSVCIVSSRWRELAECFVKEIYAYKERLEGNGSISLGDNQEWIVFCDHLGLSNYDDIVVIMP